MVLVTFSTLRTALMFVEQGSFRFCKLRGTGAVRVRGRSRRGICDTRWVGEGGTFISAIGVVREFTFVGMVQRLGRFLITLCVVCAFISKFLHFTDPGGEASFGSFLAFTVDSSIHNVF